ncbi:hypothetical protein [Oculatella sp. LEGE 06141]|uniref:hypothetical protein n=1 Tax=Oculatella sp. LEGE 06141 TaxID=1828648 RepID=UPI0030DC0C42
MGRFILALIVFGLVNALVAEGALNLPRSGGAVGSFLGEGLELIFRTRPAPPAENQDSPFAE